ncbi:hypothetical protein PMIN07_007723 [Paraphaeosphaeria minitans]
MAAHFDGYCYECRSILKRSGYYDYVFFPNDGQYQNLFSLNLLVSIMLLTLLTSAFFSVVLVLPLHAKTIDYNKAWTTKGDKIPNFLFAGHHESESVLPSLSLPARKTLSPGSGD